MQEKLDVELNRITEQLKAMQIGQAWHGKSLREALLDLDFLTASKQPFVGSPSIWALILHIISWRKFALEKIRGNEDFDIEIGSKLDWPLPGEATPQNWQNCIKALEESGLELRKLLQNRTDELLLQDVSGKSYSFYFLLHGIVQHDAYHCGQVVLTRKWLESSKT